MSKLEEEKYPARVFTEGTGFLDTRSISHYCQLKKIVRMKVYIGTDAYDDIKNYSQFGVIVKLAELGGEFRGKYIQQLLGNMLSTSMPHELWVLADGRPIIFSLHEFEHITGLKCHAEDDEDAYVADVDIWEELHLSYAQGPTWTELKRLLRICGDWSLVKRKMVGLLVVQYVGIFGLHQNSRIPSKYVKLVGVPERFEEHPWGRVAFQALIRSIRQCSMQGGQLKLNGLVNVLLVWSFEHIPRLGVMCGKRRIGGVPLLNWTSRYTRGGCLEDVFEADKRLCADKKVSDLMSYDAGWMMSASRFVEIG